jgi:hypothetical protein
MKTLLICLLLIGNQSFSQSSDSTFYLIYDESISACKIESIMLDTSKFQIQNIKLQMTGAPRIWESNQGVLSKAQQDILKKHPNTVGLILINYSFLGGSTVYKAHINFD